jgi:uncharacterized protein YdeI (YjbR/CyaY-like superfamily)
MHTVRYDNVMKTATLPIGTVHNTLPDDWRKALLENQSAVTLWHDITPLARNEWICWITEAKMQETRKRRIKVGISKMSSGMRRPCCWMGCPHRVKNGQ